MRYTTRVRTFVCTVLALLCFAAPARAAPDLPSLIKQLHDEKSTVSVRIDAVTKIGELGPEGAAAVPDLVWALTAEHPPDCDFRECIGGDIKGPVLTALKKIGPAAAAGSTPALVKMFEDPSDSWLQEAVIETLTAFGPGAAPAVPALTKYLVESRTGVGYRDNVVNALAAIGPKARPSVPVLLALFENAEKDPAADEIAKALAVLDGETDATVLVLLRPLTWSSASHVVLFSAGFAEGRKKFPAEAEPIFAQAMGSSTSGVPVVSAKSLLTFDRVSPSAVEKTAARVKTFGGGSDGTEEHYFKVLEKFGRDNEAAVEALCAQLDSSNASFGERAREILESYRTESARTALRCCSPMYRRGGSPGGKDCPKRTPDEAPIVGAVMNGDAAEIKRLLAGGADPNTKKHNGWPLLLIAADKGNAEIVRLLFERGADPAAGYSTVKTAVGAALNKKHWDLVPLLMEKGVKPSAEDFVYAAYEVFQSPVDISKVRRLLEWGLDPNQSISGGWRPLHFAVWGGSAEAVRLLLEKGADPRQQTGDGRTPLQIECKGPAGECETIRRSIGLKDEQAVIERSKSAM